MTGVVAQMRSVSSEQYTRFVAVNDRYQHRGQSNGPHSSNGGDHCGVGVLLVVLGDHVRIGKRHRHIKCKPLLRTGKEFRASHHRFESIASTE